MTTQNVSAIAGVTAYTTRAAAISGAVDSGTAFNTWMRAQTSSSSNPVTLVWDCWIYIADMAADYLQLTPTGSGYITHIPGSAIKGIVIGAGIINPGTGASSPTITFSAPAGGGTTATANLTSGSGFLKYTTMTNVGAGYTSADNPITGTLSGVTGAQVQGGLAGNCGAVWAAKSTASPCCATGNKINGDWMTSGTPIINNVTFATNANGVGITFDFNWSSGNGQPFYDSTWGLAVGMFILGIQNFSRTGMALLHSYAYILWGINWINVQRYNCIVDQGAAPPNGNDGEHWNGPGDGLYINGNYSGGFGYESVSNSDGYSISPAEPYVSTAYFTVLFPNWVGGNISNVRLVNITMSNAYQGIRFMSTNSTYTLSNIVVDGINGSFQTSVFLLDNFALDTSPSFNLYGYGLSQIIDGILIKNVTMYAVAAPQYVGRFVISNTIFKSNQFQSMIDLSTISITDTAPATNPTVWMLGTTDIYNMNWMPVPATLIDDGFQIAFNSNWTHGLTGGNDWSIVGTAPFQVAQPPINVSSNTPTLMDETSTWENTQALTGAYCATGNAGVANFGRFNTTIIGGSSSGYFVDTFPAGTVSIVRYNSGSSTTIKSWTPAGGVPTGNLVLQSAYVNNYIMVALANMGTSAPNSLVLGAVWLDSSPYTTAGYAGIFGQNNGSGAQLQFGRAKIQSLSAFSTLTSITVAYSFIDSLGRIVFTQTPNTNAYSKNGVWSLTSPPPGVTIDQFGRVSGMSYGLSVTVNYTVGGVVGTLTFQNYSRIIIGIKSITL